jgi:hypothetical protein
MQTKQPSRHKESPEVIEYIEQVEWSPPNSVTFDEVDEELMDQLVDKRIHAKDN